MISTVVGSYPSNKQAPNNLKNRILNSVSLYDEYKIAIEDAVNEQTKAGIDIISDGQVRDNMIKICAKNIIGYEFEGNVCKITSKLRSKNLTNYANDLKYALKVMNRKLDELDISKKERKNKGIKGIITGPNTMIHSSTLENNIYKTKEESILDLSEALKFEVKSLEKAGAKIIQIDEPFLSTGIVNMEIAKESIDIISKSTSIPLAMHSCGIIYDIIPDLLEFNVDILDFEFAGNNKNINIFKDYGDNLGRLGLGCIDTKKTSIETTKEISNIIKNGLDVLDPKNLFIDPDCGMRVLPRDIAFSKLKQMVKAMKSLENDNS
ncbi:MAG: methionine synthase [Methanobrevibacter sp.]|jgi:5-methyltetrahydropteroyltriglutamate--homocysteine methyltransferase|nr:methionine synthase [Candidatus Methanovirga basalitermitum]